MVFCCLLVVYQKLENYFIKTQKPVILHPELRGYPWQDFKNQFRCEGRLVEKRRQLSADTPPDRWQASYRRFGWALAGKGRSLANQGNQLNVA